MEKLEQLYTVDGNVKWCTTMDNTMEDPQKLKIEPPYNPATLLLDIYPKELKYGSPRAICSPLFTVALFTIMNMWKHSKYLSTDEWKRRTGICTGAILAQEKNGTMPAAAP